MSYQPSDFSMVAADFLRGQVVPVVKRDLAALQAIPHVEEREARIAAVAAWLADLDAARDAAALAPPRFGSVLETMWLLGLVGVVPDPAEGGRFVDVAMRLDLGRAVQLAAAAASALDLLRGTTVAEAWARRQVEIVDRLAAAAAATTTDAAGSA